MTMNEIRDVLRKQPFERFRVRLTTGQSYDVTHPEFAAVTQFSLFVGEPTDDDSGPQRMVQCDLMHVVAIEPLGAAAERNA